jgi:hypothetical protein
MNVTDALTWPNLVGMHWCIWEDCPPTGRTWDGEVFSVGLVNIADVPYAGMATAIQQGNATFHKRLLLGRPVYFH